MAGAGGIDNDARIPRVLLGTSDESYLKSVRRTLQEAGYRVEVALDSETVMASLEPKRYDLAVLDTGLGKIDDLSIFDRLRMEPEGRRLYLIALVDPDEKPQLGAPIGPDDCVAKPFEIADLLTSVQIAIRIVTPPARARLRHSSHLDARHDRCAHRAPEPAVDLRHARHRDRPPEQGEPGLLPGADRHRPHAGDQRRLRHGPEETWPFFASPARCARPPVKPTPSAGWATTSS